MKITTNLFFLMLFVPLYMFSDGDIYIEKCMECHGMRGYSIYSRCNNCHNNYIDNALTKKKFTKGFIDRLEYMKKNNISPSLVKCPSLYIPQAMYDNIKTLNKSNIKTLANYIYKESKKYEQSNNK